MGETDGELMSKGFAEGGFSGAGWAMQEYAAVPGDEVGIYRHVREDHGRMCVVQQPLLHIIIEDQAGASFSILKGDMATCPTARGRRERGDIGC